MGIAWDAQTGASECEQHDPPPVVEFVRTDRQPVDDLIWRDARQQHPEDRLVAPSDPLPISPSAPATSAATPSALSVNAE